jgi:hypothetical protein
MQVYTAANGSLIFGQYKSSPGNHDIVWDDLIENNPTRFRFVNSATRLSIDGTNNFIDISDCTDINGVTYTSHVQFSNAIESFFVKALTVDEGALDTRITNLESNDTIYQVYSNTGTTQTGAVTIPQEAAVYDLYNDAVVDYIVVKASPEGSPLDELVKTASGQTVTVVSLDQLGNYVLSGIPTVNACLVYFISVQDKYKENVPLSMIVDHIDIDFIAQMSTAKETLATLEGNGVVSGMRLSINTDTTKFNIASGIYHIIGGGDMSYAGLAGITAPAIAVSNSTYIGLNINGTVAQQLTPFTPAQRRTIIPLGIIIHSNRTVINAVNSLPDIAVNELSQFNDLLDGLKGFNAYGNKFSPNGANLSINKSIGAKFQRGINFENDTLNPHLKVLPALVSPSTIRYRTSTGEESVDTNVVLLNYDIAGAVNAIPGGRFSIQRIFLFPSNLVRIQYGQTTYASMQLAQQALLSETFVAEENIAQNGMLRAYLIVRGGATTSLEDTARALFIEADKWGEMPLGTTGGTTSLQQAYENSITPEITTNATLGAVTIQNGGVDDAINVFEVKNLVGQNKAEIKGDGTSRFGDIIGGNYTEIESDGTIVAKGAASVFRDELPSYLVPAAGGAAPDSVAHTIGGVARQLYSFDGNATVEILSGSFEIPHDWKVDSEIEIHIHWRPSTTGTGNVEWHFDWEYSTPQGAPVPKTALSGVATIPAAQQYWHKLDQIGLINATGFSLGGKIGFNLRRSPSGINDTYGADALLEQIAMHVEIDTLGSRQRYIK